MRRHALLPLLAALLIIALAGCATLDATNPAGGQSQATTTQITAQDALRTADREIKLAAVDINDACQSGLLSPPKCELAKAAIVEAAKAYNALLANQAAGLPITEAACLAVLTTMKTKLAEVAR